MDERSKPRADRRRLTHVDRGGRPRMVDVSAKAITARRAVAEAEVICSQETLSLVIDGRGPKGDVLTVAEIAGVMGGKRTAELIPLCHPLALTDLVVTITPDRAASALRVRAEAATVGPTGVEMEALVAASVAALTVYDMVKGVEKGVEIRHVRLVSKVGGKSGEWRREGSDAGPAAMTAHPGAPAHPTAPVHLTAPPAAAAPGRGFLPAGPPVVRAKGMRGPARAGGIRRSPRRPGP
jgi:cyclic pyranopterin phosphate synthase